MKRFILFFILTYLSFSAHLQVPDLKFYSLPNETHLSGSYTTCIAQDTCGFVWIGTTDGLNRFDGYDFKVYKSKQEDKSSLISNNIINLYNDSKGRLWVGSKLGLCVYNPYYDSFDRIATPNDPAGLENSYITCINEDQNSNLFVSAGNQIFLFDEMQKKFSKILSIETGAINSFLFDLQNNIWIGSHDEGGLYFYNTHLGSITRYLNNNEDINSLSNNNVVSLALRGDTLWITTSGGGINSLNLKNMKFKRYPSYGPYDKYGRVLYLDRDNYLWQCDFTGLKLYDENNDSFYGYYNNKASPFSIKKNVISIFQDRQGNYWTLHSPGGVGISYVPRGFFGFNTNPEGYWTTSNDIISAICEDEAGNLWLGNPNNGLDIFYWQQGKEVNYIHNPENKYSLGKGSVFTIFRDSRNVMWTGTYFGGLQYFDKKTGRFISFVNNPDDTSSIVCNDVRSITEDSQGNLWIIVHGKGVDKFDIKEKKFYHFNSKNNNLSNDWAFQILCDQEDNIWVASVWGLNLLRKDGKVFKNFFSDANDTTSLSGNEIVSIYLDGKKNLWVGTINGLNLYIKETENFKRINLDAASNYICAILDDHENNIWASTLKGLVMFNPESGIRLNFDNYDGLLANEFSVRSAFKNKDNDLFFGSLKGVNVIKPETIKINTTKPKVIISGLKLFYEDVTDYSPTSILQKSITYTDTLILRYRQNILSFEFLALNMIHAHKNQYEYKLEGFDPRWNKAGNKREASYTNLNPGKYTFRVRASNNDGVWNYEGISLFIRILPPWYMMWWFYILCFFIVTGLLILFYLNRTRQLRRQKNILSQKVEERTKQLSDINEILKAQTNNLNDTNALLEERQQRIEEQSKSLARANEELRILNSGKDKLFSIIAHDLRGPFNNILGFSDILLKDFDKMDEVQKKNISGYIYTSTNKVYNLLENLLKWAASQTNKLSFSPDIINISEIIHDNIHLYNDIAKKKGIELKADKIDADHVFADYEMVNAILRNLITNAIKFTLTEGTVEVIVSKESRMAKISVTDTGIGMESKYLQHLFSLEYNESRPGTNDERGSGLGLILCKEFVEKNGGTISVTSVVGKGSNFTFTLPLSQQS